MHGLTFAAALTGLGSQLVISWWLLFFAGKFWLLDSFIPSHKFCMQISLSLPRSPWRTNLSVLPA